MNKTAKMTRLASVLFAVILSLSMFSFTAIAAPRIADGDKGSITVTNVDSTATATAYQIMTVNFNYDANQPADPEYIWADGAVAYISAHYPQYINTADHSVTDAYAELAKSDNSAQARTFFADLAAAIKDGSITATGKSAGVGPQTIGNLDMGSYLVLIEGGVKIYQPIAVNVVPTYNSATDSWSIDNQTITNTKSTLPTIDKQVDESQKNFSIGDDVHYTVTATVPTYPQNATAKAFEVSDTLSESLTYNKDAKVYGVGADNQQTLLTEGVDYTVATARLDGQTADFVIKFNYDKISQYTKVAVKYSAKLNEKTVIGDAGNKNAAKLIYNNNPYDNSTWKDGDSTVDVYSLGFDITKIDNTTQAALTGAEFTLSATEGGEAIHFVQTSAGHYTKAVDGQTGTTTLAVDNNGKLILSGLKAGTYYLTETKAPAGGYKVPSKPFTLTVKDDDNDGIADGFTTGYAEVKVENSKGFSLPSTGGAGTVMFAVGGVALIALGGAMIVVLRKKSKTAENN